MHFVYDEAKGNLVGKKYVPFLSSPDKWFYFEEHYNFLPLLPAAMELMFAFFSCPLPPWLGLFVIYKLSEINEFV